MIAKVLLLLTTVTFIFSAFNNPGVLISVPFPMSPPTLKIALPQTINDIVVKELELTSVYLREVDYKWKLSATQADVNVTQAQISFDWSYKTDSGKGFFTQDDLRLIFAWTFNATKSNRFEIVVADTKIHPGKMKVTLGGQAKETVIVEVTNLILNHASILFRGFIANKISQEITSASKILGEDIEIYADAATKKHIKINTTLVSNPLINNQTLVIQMNGSPYIVGESSGFLNPSDVLVKAPGQKIQAQIHKQFIVKLIELVLKIKGEIALSIHTLDITSVIDIDSLALSPVFPPMAYFSKPKDVILDVKISSINFEFVGNSLAFKGYGSVTISTEEKGTQSKILYMDMVSASAGVQVTPLFGAYQASIRMDSLAINSFVPAERDIEKGLIIPEALSKYFPVLMEWLTDGINFALNPKVKKFGYSNILAVLHGRVLNNVSYNIEVDLIQKP